MSVVADKLKSNERKTMENYNPTVSEMINAYTVAYGENGVYALAGAMFANLSEQTIERLYRQAIADVREDLLEKGLV
jgi:hypothetical protein